MQIDIDTTTAEPPAPFLLLRDITRESAEFFFIKPFYVGPFCAVTYSDYHQGFVPV